ncbi:MAG: hypothetical protein HY279_00920 [Nitrospinae bacterium]|nr:hypothetical protein [Nitrospinota bacterium]
MCFKILTLFIICLILDTPVVLGDQTGNGESEQLRLDLLKVRLLYETDRDMEALRLSELLLEKYPQDSRVLSNLAYIEWRIGQWRKAYMLYNQAIKIEPDNEGIVMGRDKLWHEQASRVKIRHAWKNISGAGGWEERLTDANGHIFIADYTRLGVIYHNNSVKTDSIRRADGKIAPFEGMRNRGEIFLQHDAENSSIIKLSLLANSSTPGAGVLFSLWDISGRTVLFGELKHPYWDYIEGIIEDGTRDRIGITREQKLGSRLNLQLGTAFEQYGIPADDNVAASQSVSGNLRFIVVKMQPLVTLGYNLDADYLISIDKRADSAGVEYNPWTIRSREIHSLDVTVSYFIEGFLTDGYAGYSSDRLGAHGAFYGVSFTYIPIEDIEIIINYDRGLNSVITSQTIEHIRGSLVWRF